MDFNDDEMRRIMQWMRENRWTVSDTPGMGNVPAWSIGNAGMLAPSGYGYPIDKEYVKKQKEINRHVPYLPDVDARREIEGRLMDDELAGVLGMWQQRRPQMRPMGMLPAKINGIDGSFPPPRSKPRTRHSGGGVRG